MGQQACRPILLITFLTKNDETFATVVVRCLVVDLVSVLIQIGRYGGAIIGPFRVFGLRKAVPMGRTEALFVEVTKSFRRQRWPGAEKWAVISIDQACNSVELDAEGKIWTFDHDTRTMQVIATSFEAYLRKLCLNLPD